MERNSLGFVAVGVFCWIELRVRLGIRFAFLVGAPSLLVALVTSSVRMSVVPLVAVVFGVLKDTRLSERKFILVAVSLDLGR